MDKDKKNKIIKYSAAIVLLIVIIIFLYFVESNRAASKIQNTTSNNAVNLNNVNFSNNANNQVTNFTFTNINDLAVKEADVYQPQQITDFQFSQIASNLGMKNSDNDADLNLLGYKDNNNNNVTLSSDRVTLSVENKNNPSLKNFSKDIILTRLGSIFTFDTSNYIFVTQVANPGSTTTYSYSFKIQTFPLISDFNEDISLYVTIDASGNMVELRWKTTFPASSGIYKLISMDAIKKQFATISKGIYPDFPPLSTALNQDESFKNIQDFKGRIEIISVQLAYFWSSSNKNSIIPVYRFGTKFYFDDGKVTDGSIIVNAVDTTNK